MRVWIDQDLCTGDGLCVDHCPDVFVQLEDGIAYVAESAVALNDPGGSGSLASVPFRRHRAVIEAAELCPGECIFIEMPVTELREIEAEPAEDEPDEDAEPLAS
ncbi:MAG: ferredoxin [Acidimicrobiia bacterium]